MRKFVVVGGGPAGSTIAAFLAKKGNEVLVFDDYVERDLYVGESLIPAVIPVLKKLGVEDEVKSFSVYKPGATVWLDKEEYAEASFDSGSNTLPPYAYNTPRIKFDACLRKNAEKTGAQFVKEKAKIIFQDDQCQLPQNILDKYDDFFKGQQPDFFIDATGRKRLFANQAKLEAKKGKRQDVALFAHVEGNTFDQNYGDIHMHRAEYGWCWRIPLPEKTSIGVVLKKENWEKMGTTKEERFDNFLKKDGEMSHFLKDCKRLSEVQQYSNYQMESKRFYGKNWVLIGDAAGFLDPVFSSGLYLSMAYAEKVADLLHNNKSLRSYQRSWKKEVKSWKKMIDIWYNGRLFTTYRVGQGQLENRLGRAIGPHVEKHFTSIFTGEAVKSSYSMGLLSFMTGFMIDLMKKVKLHDHKIEQLEIK